MTEFLADHPRTAAWVGIGMFVACVAVTALEGAS